MIQIPRHQVRASEKDLIIPSVPEIEEATVLEKTANHRTHADVTRESVDARTQCAGAADDQIDFDAACEA